MPEHFRLLLEPQPADSTPLITKEQETAQRILRSLRENLQYPWRRRILARLRLPPSVHDESHLRP